MSRMNRDSTYVSYESVDYDIHFTKVPSYISPSEFGWKNKDEILLDPDDRPLELAVNSKFPVAFHLVASNDRNKELLKHLQSEQFNIKQKRKLFESTNTNEERASTISSSASIPCHRGSISGSSENGSANKQSKYPESKSHSSTTGMAKFNSNCEVERKASLKETFYLSSSSSPSIKPTRSSSMPKHERPFRYSHGGFSKVIKEEESDFRTFTLSKKSSSRTGRVRQVKNKKENSKLTRKSSRSASARKLFSTLRHYRARSASRERSGSRPPSDSDDNEFMLENAELSSDATLPGILKIFGDAVSPGANYKSVMANTNSTAKELVKIALERYGVFKQEADNYVLCEVLGKIYDDQKIYGNNNNKGLKLKQRKNKRKYESSVDLTQADINGKDFIEDYVRPLNDQEKPLVLQSYWKPQEGLSRRFEIKLRSQVFNQEEEVDSNTRKVNIQAKRLILHKSRTNLSIRQNTEENESDEEKITSFEETPNNISDDLMNQTTRQSSENSLSSLSESAAALNQDQDRTNEANLLDDVSISAERATPVGNATSVDEDGLQEKNVTKTLQYPYLITLQGNEDSLIHLLDKEEVLIGSDVTDFKLVAADVLPHHCVIQRRLETFISRSSDSKAFKHWCVTIKPLNLVGEIRINGGRITSKHTLQHGELISVGKQHLFMYKDPSSNINLSNLVSLSFTNSNNEADNCSTEARGSNSTINSIGLPENKSSPWQETIYTLLNYKITQEENILKQIFHCVSKPEHVIPEYSLFPATLLCHSIFHACLNFDVQFCNDLLLKISSTLQTLVLNATRNVSIHEVQSLDSNETGRHLFSPLRQVMFWMSNSLEVFEFLQNDLINQIKQRVKEEREKNRVDPDFLTSVEGYKVNEEILVLLEEVVMYAFQQLVYYLTKILYGCLPAILECNPFADSQNRVSSVIEITDVFSRALEMTATYNVNDRITEQLFAYLFFFTNVSIFNTLMEEESFKYYKWEMGIRIRGNLEFIEQWSDENGCGDQCTKHLEKISVLANLLATPRAQILRNNWTSLRKNFSSLNAAQLYKILTEYQIPSNQLRPPPWKPTDNEMRSALSTDLILESYDNHPPLMLPAYGCRINLSCLPVGQYYTEVYEQLKSHGVWFLFEKQLASSTQREQPDGRELLRSDTVTSLVDANDHDKPINQILTSLTNLSVSKKTRFENVQGASFDFSDGIGRNPTSICCSSSSSEADAQQLDQMPKRNIHPDVPPLKDINLLNQKNKRYEEKDESDSDFDELLVLPISETASLLSKVSQNKGHTMSPSNGSSKSSKSSQDETDITPKEVFIVDIKKGNSGLVVGFIDGTVTSLRSKGIYVRSLLPDDPASPHTSSKHHEVMRCWLQEGRLQLGDRILAANGESLINMKYNEAINIIKKADTKVRLLVGRCGSEVSSKITSNS